MSNILFSLENGALTVKMSGEIDHHFAVSIREKTDEKIYEQRPKKIVLDLTDIKFMDSSGLGLIMGRYNLAKKLGSDFALKGADSRTIRILNMAGMDKIIKLEAESEEVQK